MTKKAKLSEYSRVPVVSSLVSKKAVVLAMLSILVLCACTAGSRGRVLARFPDDISVQDFIFIKTNLIDCTFAEVSIDTDVTIDPSRFQASLEALDALEQSGPFSYLEFPDDGFHYFSGVSLVELISLIGLKGDSELEFIIGEWIFASKQCMPTTAGPLSQAKVRYRGLISDSDLIIVIGADQPNTVILVDLAEARAYYLGP